MTGTIFYYMNLPAKEKYYPLQVINQRGNLQKFYLIASSYEEARKKSRLPATEREQEQLKIFITTYEYLKLSFEFENQEQVEEFKWQFRIALQEALVRVFYVYYNSERRDEEWDVETMIINLIQELFTKQISRK